MWSLNEKSAKKVSLKRIGVRGRWIDDQLGNIFLIRLSRKIFKLISVRLISRLPIVGLGKGWGGGGEIGLEI
jgi:hypothetical protein